MSGAMTENYLSATGFAVTYHQPIVGIGITQNLINFNAFSTYTKALFSGQLSNLQLHLDQENLSLKIIKAYFDVLYANDTLNAIKIVKEFYTKEYKKAQLSYKTGMISEIDINDSKASLDEALSDEIKTLNQLNTTKNIFHNLTGENPDLIQPLITTINLLTPNKNDIQQLESIAASNNPNVMIAKLQVDMAKEDISIAKSGNLPNVSLYGTYAYLGNPAIDATDSAATTALLNEGAGTPGSFLSSYTLASAGIQVSIPIFSGGGISSQTRAAMENYVAATHSLDAAKRQTNIDVQNAYWQVINGISLVNASTKALQSAKLKLKSDEIAYRLGTRNSINLMNAEKNYYEALQSYNQSRYNYLLGTAQLAFLTNTLDTNFISDLNQNIAQ
jgi:outer membrane protein